MGIARLEVSSPGETPSNLELESDAADATIEADLELEVKGRKTLSESSITALSIDVADDPALTTLTRDIGR